MQTHIFVFEHKLNESNELLFPDYRICNKD